MPFDEVKDYFNPKPVNKDPHAKIYTTYLISEFINRVPIEYLKVLFKECLEYANSSENIYDLPITNFDANIMYSNDYWKKEKKINRVWVRKRDKQQFWRFLENWYDL